MSEKCQQQKSVGLFDHMVSDRKHFWRQFDAERLCRLKIDDSLKVL
jgi:hypothetical protein